MGQPEPPSKKKGKMYRISFWLSPSDSVRHLYVPETEYSRNDRSLQEYPGSHTSITRNCTCESPGPVTRTQSSQKLCENNDNNDASLDPVWIRVNPVGYLYIVKPSVLINTRLHHQCVERSKEQIRLWRQNLETGILYESHR